MIVDAWDMIVKRQHVGLLQWVWTKLVPDAYAAISEEDAQQAWAMFAKNPADPNMANAKRMANELWMLYIRGN